MFARAPRGSFCVYALPCMDRRVRLTPLGVALLIVLVAALVALFFGSRGLQAVGFTVATVVLLLLIGDQFPRRLRLWWVGQPPGNVDARRRGVQEPGTREQNRGEPGPGSPPGE
jgi:MFS family permease